MFNGSGVVQGNMFGEYGPKFLEPKCGNQSVNFTPNVTNPPKPRRNDTPSVVISILN